MRRNKAGRFVSRQKPLFGITEEPSNMSSVYSDFANTKNLKAPIVPAKSWSLTKKIPPKPYEPKLKDVYPRNDVTMMPMEIGFPKYYDGRFLRENYADQLPLEKERKFIHDRGMMFKPSHIGNVQTKKKYNEEIKGKSSVSLHLCNDTHSDLFQRSLHKDFPRPESKSSANSENSGISLSSAGSSSVFDVKDRDVPLDDRRLRSGRVVADIDLASVLFPRAKVVNSLKFMGAPIFRNTSRSREYDINFHGKR